ncbi:MAG: DUF1801 domain-containing protein, partial [Candidatus Dojkabacteria bacterium]
ESIVGFDEYHYKYKSGQEGDWLAVGFSPRKGKISLYLTYSLEEYMKYYDSLAKLKHGKVCLYVKDLEDLDKQELKKLIERSYKEIKETNHIAE